MIMQVDVMEDTPAIGTFCFMVAIRQQSET